jgi:hypothetical protein
MSENNILVIGNGPDILENEYGKFIDNNFDTIIRCNIAPIITFETFVGTKTNYRICFSKILGKLKENLPNDKNLIVSIPNFEIKKFRHFKGCAKNFRNNNPDYNINILGRKILEDIFNTYEIKNPSVGFIALYKFSEKFTKKIYYIGFDGYTSEKSHYYHILESNKRNNFHKKNANNFHNLAKEREILNDKIEKGLILHIKNIYNNNV